MQWFKVFVIGLIGAGLALPAMADELRTVAESTASCRSIEDSTARLACFDSASLALAEALRSVAEEPSPTAQSAEPLAQAETDEPSWAAAPLPPEPTASASGEDAQEPREFEVVIVRITVNSAGRHKFYTDDGAVWEQTVIEQVRPPRSLPAVAELKQRVFGNPTIKFDVSNQSYRVRRLE